jgi:hypothetical protein
MEFSYGKPSYFEMKEALDNLELVCKLLPGSTIDTNLRCIVDHNHWYSTYVRSMYHENRYKTIIWLEDLFEKVSNLMIHLEYLTENTPPISPKSDQDGFELLECIESPYQTDGEEEETVIVKSIDVPPDILNPTIDPAERKGQLVDLMSSANEGLKNMLMTYKNDIMIVSRLHQIMDTMRVVKEINITPRPSISIENPYITNNFFLRLCTWQDPFRYHIRVPAISMFPVLTYDNRSTTPEDLSEVD